MWRRGSCRETIENVGWHSGVDREHTGKRDVPGSCGSFPIKTRHWSRLWPTARTKQREFFRGCFLFVQAKWIRRKKGKVKTHLALVASSLSLSLGLSIHLFQALYGTKQKLWFPLELMLHVFFFLPFHYNKIKKRPENKTHSRGRPRGNVSVGIAAPSEC